MVRRRMGSFEHWLICDTHGDFGDRMSGFVCCWHNNTDVSGVDNGGRCDLRVSFVPSVVRFFSRTFDGVIDKNTLSRVA